MPQDLSSFELSFASCSLEQLEVDKENFFLAKGKIFSRYNDINFSNVPYFFTKFFSFRAIFLTKNTGQMRYFLS